MQIENQINDSGYLYKNSDSVFHFQGFIGFEHGHLISKTDTIKNSEDTGFISFYKNPLFKDELINIDLKEKSLFTSHGLRIDNVKPGALHKLNNEWILGVFLLCFVIFTFVYTVYFRRLKQVFNSIISFRNLNLLVREGNIFKEIISIPLFLIYIFTISLFIYLVLSFYLKFSLAISEGYIFYFKIVFFVIIVIILKMIILLFMGILFKHIEINNLYILNFFLLDVITGIILFPLLIFIVYVESINVLYFCFIIIIIKYIIRLVRGFFIARFSIKFSQFYLFLYLCSLEILPMVVLLKILVNYYQANLL